jgi:hypothetical protein
VSRLPSVGNAVNVALVLDLSMSMRTFTGNRLSAAVTHVVGSLPSDNAVMTVGFNSRAYLLSDLVRDRESLPNALKQPVPMSSGRRLYDAVLATTQRPGAATGRNALVLVTDGLDVGSDVADAATLEAMASSDQIPVYVLQFNTPPTTRITVPPNTNAQVIPAGALDPSAQFTKTTGVLRRLSETGHGWYALVDSADAIPRSFARLAEALKR